MHVPPADLHSAPPEEFLSAVSLTPNPSASCSRLQGRHHQRPQVHGAAQAVPLRPGRRRVQGRRPEAVRHRPHLRQLQGCGFTATLHYFKASWTVSRCGCGLSSAPAGVLQLPLRLPRTLRMHVCQCSVCDRSEAGEKQPMLIVPLSPVLQAPPSAAKHWRR